MEFWIENGNLLTWLDDSRRIQEKIIAVDVIDGDYNARLDEWLVTRSNGTVELLSGSLHIASRTYSRDGITARWSNGANVIVRENNGQTNVYDYRGFLERTM